MARPEQAPAVSQAQADLQMAPELEPELAFAAALELEPEAQQVLEWAFHFALEQAPQDWAIGEAPSNYLQRPAPSKS